MALAHRLRHRVDIQQRTPTRDSNGDLVESGWTDVYTSVPAEVLTGAGREALANGQLNSTIAARITIRARSGLTHGMRVVHGSVIYHLETSYMDVTQAGWMVLVCSAGVINE